MKELDIRCEKCSRFLNLKGIRCLIGKVRCPSSNCKHLNNVKIVNDKSSPEDIHFKFAVDSA